MSDTLMTALRTAPRTGSYPLMNLAEDYGVDYGDVLIWAHLLRHRRISPGRPYPAGRLEEVHRALNRIAYALGDTHTLILPEMVAHADARWEWR